MRGGRPRVLGFPRPALLNTDRNGKEEEEMHENPGATDEEQELAQTDRMQEEEAQRGAHSTAEEPDGEDEADGDEK
jgi:hypothetical protein